jgi:hypothetical protein
MLDTVKASTKSVIAEPNASLKVMYIVCCNDGVSSQSIEHSYHEIFIGLRISLPVKNIFHKRYFNKGRSVLRGSKYPIIMPSNDSRRRKI